MSRDLLASIQAYIERYVTFTNPDYSYVAALWAAGTFLFPRPVKEQDGSYSIPAVTFDAFPYLVITSDTKRSGKTRFSEVLSFLSSRPRNFAGASAAAVFRSIRNECPTMFNDEAELLAGENASTLREVLNTGYRRGQSIARADGTDEVKEWVTYCAKVFILIGDVYDTLRDRSIVVRMQRGEAKTRFVYDKARQEGAELRDRLEATVRAHRDSIADAYTTHAGLTFLSDRDEEIWLPLFAVCAILAPHRITELQRIAVDMATEKTSPARRYTNLQGAEAAAEDDEYSRRLLQDLASIFTKAERAVFTKDALTRLHEIVTGPWRKFRGAGLTAIDLANMLSRYGLEPKLVRIGGKKGTVARGYQRAEVERAAKGVA